MKSKRILMIAGIAVFGLSIVGCNHHSPTPEPDTTTIAPITTTTLEPVTTVPAPETTIVTTPVTEPTPTTLPRTE